MPPTDTVRYPRLFSPITVGSKRLKNRIVFPSVIPNYAADQHVTDRNISLYRERAVGGAAMIVSEAMAVHHSSAPKPTITIYDPANFDGLRRMAAAVEEHDCRIIGQLYHAGRQRLWNSITSSIGVSALPDEFSWAVPHVMSKADIAEIVEAFVNSARTLQQAGFSGVELHGAHGFLLAQFMSPWSNVRDDEYGGDLDRRTRFVRDVIAGIRAACGDGFVIGLKMPGDERVAGGLEPEAAAETFRRINAETPVDYVGFAQGNLSLSLEDHIPDMHYPPGPYLDIQKDLRMAADGTPVVAVGRITSAAQAEAVLGDGTGDLVGLGRMLVSDAAFPVKVMTGRQDEVRPCIFCNVCWAEVQASRPMVCIHNPRLATPGEADWAPPPPTGAGTRRVTVVGAGVAGLEVAWTAAARGHEVTLLSSEDIGGKARLESSLPGREEVARVFEFQHRRAEAHQVRIVRGDLATEETVAATSPDVVVLATGARMRPPPSLEAGSETGISVRDYALETDRRLQGEGTAVLFDFDHTAGTYAVADLLAERYSRTVVITPRMQLGSGVPYVSLLGVYRRLHNRRVEISTCCVPVRLDNGSLECANVFTDERTKIDDVAVFTWSTPRLVNDALFEPLVERGFEVHLVGDSFSPRTMLAAIHEGHALGLGL